MRVSIIVPVYNAEKYIHRCMNSILNQTYKNIDVILVDDGSTDSSLNICNQYKYEDNRIRVIHRNNGGVSAARNSGLSISLCSSLIMFLDSDDWIDMNAVELCVNEFSKDRALDCVLFPYVREFGIIKKKNNHLGNEKIVYHKDDVYKKIFRRFFGPIGKEKLRVDACNDISAVWGKCYKSSILADIHFKEGLTASEDLMFNVEAFSKVNKAIYLPNVYYHYNKLNTDSIVHGYNEKLYYTRIYLYDLLETIINEKNLGKEFSEALNNRRVFEVLDLCRNIMNSQEDIFRKHKIMRDTLNDNQVCKWFELFDFSGMGIHWKIFFSLCKWRVTASVMLMTWLAERLKSYLR